MYSIISALNGVYPESRGISAKRPSRCPREPPATAERRLTATMAAISRLANRKLPHVTTTPEYLAHILVPSTAYRANTAVDSRGERDARRADGRIQRIDQDKDAEAFQHQRHDVLAQDLRAQDEPGENEHEHGIAAEQDGDDEAFVFSTAS